MKRLLTLTLLSASIFGFAQTLPPPVQLPNGWKLTPAGVSMPLGDLPLNMVVSPSSKYMAVTNNGQGIQTIELIDIATQKKVDSIVIARSWYGLVFSPDEKYLYASGGHNNRILQYELQKTKLVLADSITLGEACLEIRECPKSFAVRIHAAGKLNPVNGYNARSNHNKIICHRNSSKYAALARTT